MDEAELQALVEQVDKGELPDDHQVPVSVVKAIRQELKAIKESSASKDDELLLYKSTVRNLQNQGPGSGKQQTTTQPSVVDQFFSGREDDDVPTVKELKQLTAMVTATTEAHNRNSSAMQHVQSQPDFNNLVYKHFPEYLKSLPPGEAQELAREIQSIPSEVARFRLAYRYGKLSPEYLAKTMTEKPKHDDAKKIEENASKPRSTATVGASGAASSSDFDRITAAKPGTPEFRALQKEFASRKRGD